MKSCENFHKEDIASEEYDGGFSGLELEADSETWADWDEEDFKKPDDLDENDLLAQEIDSFKHRRLNFQQERAQELFERKLNAEMTDIDELVMFAENDVEGLSLETIRFNNKDIKIVHVDEYPVKFLKSSINSSKIRDNPELWTINGNSYKSFSGDEGANIEFDPSAGNVSNTICTTYIDTDINSDAMSGSSVQYVFSHVRSDSVINADIDDIWSSPDSGFRRPSLLKNGEILMPEDIARNGKKTMNEVTLRRYDEKGNPLLPTALLSIERHGKLNLDEEVLNTAQYFNIPILAIRQE